MTTKRTSCWFHRWGAWEQFEQQMIWMWGPGIGTPSRVVRKQRRHCIRCNKEQVTTI